MGMKRFLKDVGWRRGVGGGLSVYLLEGKGGWLGGHE